MSGATSGVFVRIDPRISLRACGLRLPTPVSAISRSSRAPLASGVGARVTPGHSTALALIAPNAFDLCHSTNSPGIVVSMWQRRSFPLSIRCFDCSVCLRTISSALFYRSPPCVGACRKNSAVNPQGGLAQRNPPSTRKDGGLRRSLPSGRALRGPVGLTHGLPACAHRRIY
jgi:hypothetical protein